jgi:hydroxypyruvate isomerase
MATMPKFAASVSWLFQDVPLLERFKQAAAAGFRAVEVQAPYEESAEDLAAELRRHDLEAVLINVQPGLAAMPDREAEFRDALERALSYAETMHCRQLHCVAGRTEGDQRAEATFLANLRWAEAQARAQDVRLLLEPLNTTDNPGYFLTGSNQAREIIDAIGSPHVAMQFDCYHLQIMEGSLTESLRCHLDVVAHIQIGGVPGRREPDARQEINYPYLFDLVDELGFEGWVGCEYAASEGSDGLGWAAPFGIGSARNTTRS